MPFKVFHDTGGLEIIFYFISFQGKASLWIQIWPWTHDIAWPPSKQNKIKLFCFSLLLAGGAGVNHYTQIITLKISESCVWVWERDKFSLLGSVTTESAFVAFLIQICLPWKERMNNLLKIIFLCKGKSDEKGTWWIFTLFIRNQNKP